MKRAKIALSAVTMLTVMGTALAFKAVKRSVFTYFTTTVYNATATKTLTAAITVSPAPSAAYRYYTLIDGSKATLHSYVSTNNAE